MKKIGLVGGTGPESTLMYYKELNSRIDALTNGAAMPEITIESVNFRQPWQWVTSGRTDLLAEHLAEKVKNLKKCGCGVMALTAVTMHMVYDELVEKTGVPLISIPGAVRDEALRLGISRIGLIGTAFTMDQDYMKKPLREAGIGVITPRKEERELIAKRIFEELELGIVKEETLREFNAVLSRMKAEEGIEAVILGCTELPLLLNSGNCAVPCLDSVDIHINRLISLAME
ncbi:MAG: aspartate racemase [Clostridiales bacterium]|nr:aspartate racemase [Clostridiales bacterium]